MRDPLAPLSPDEAPARMVIGLPRKDGKYPVSFIFPSSGRTFRQILTLEKVRAGIATEHYLVLGYVPRG